MAAGLREGEDGGEERATFRIEILTQTQLTTSGMPTTGENVYNMLSSPGFLLGSGKLLLDTLVFS